MHQWSEIDHFFTGNNYEVCWRCEKCLAFKTTAVGEKPSPTIRIHFGRDIMTCEETAIRMVMET